MFYAFAKFSIKVMNKYRIVFAIVFLSNVILAQSSGYMGRKLVAGYGFYFSTGYIGSNGATPLNMLHEGYLEYATSKNFCLGFSARMYKAVYENGRSVDIRYYDPYNSNYYYGYNGDSYTDVPSGYYRISAVNYMLYGKVFSRNYVAPWGRYFTFGVTLNTFKTRYDPYVMNISIYDYNYYSNTPAVRYTDFGPIEQSFKKLDLMIGSGRSRIIANRVVIDYGYNINLLAMALTVFDATDDNILFDENLKSNDYIQKTAAARIRGVNRVNLFLKVGFLLF